jgi:hypothetical protein
MILAAVVSVSLLVTAAHDIGVEDPASAARMSMSQKSAVLRPLVSSATDCIARSVAADPRLKEVKDGDIGDLIVESMPACVERVRAMIDTYDRLFGNGSGEAFFMGPYLDLLPAVVTKQIKGSAE